MTLQQLRYFCTACEYRSITRAAEQLFVTQPTVSSAIHELEKEYHISLLERKGKGFFLTQHGEAFYRHSLALLNQVKDFDHSIRKLAEQRRCVKLGITRAVGSSIYEEYYHYGQENHPNIDIVTTTETQQHLLAKLQAQSLDLIIISSQMGDHYEDLECRELKKTRALYCLSQNHPLAREKSLTVPMVLTEKMVSTVDDDKKTQRLRCLFAPYHAEPNVIQRYDQFHLALAMVKANIATGYFPEEAIRGYHGIVGIPLEEEPEISVYLLWNHTSLQKEEVRVFIKSITRFYGNNYT